MELLITGFEKLLNFILITVPISIIISQKFNTKDRNFFILVLLGVSSFSFLITIYSFSSISLSRSGVLEVVLLYCLDGYVLVL